MIDKIIAYLWEYLQMVPYTLPAVLIALVCHEFAHGWASHLLGDPTPKVAGRLSLNPLRHLDPLGTLCLLLFRMGWAKPVPIDPRYYRQPRKGVILVGLAGPATNFVLALLFSLLQGLVLRFAPYSWLSQYVYTLFYCCAVINISLGLFNLLPIPPLDGSRILGNLIPPVGMFMDHYHQIWRPVLLALMFTGVLSDVLVAGNNMVYEMLWGMVCWLLGMG